MDMTTHELTPLIVDIQKVFHEQKYETYSEESEAIAELFERHKALLLSFVSGSFPLADKFEGKTKEEILQGAKRLCEIYFDIASESIGENEVRRIRDERLGGNEC